MSNLNTGVFKIKRIIYPQKATHLDAGDYGIVACDLVATKEGKFKKNKYGNYSIKGVMPIFDLHEDSQEEFTIVANEIKDERYPNTYQIETIFTSHPINTEEERKYFLSKILTDKQLESLYDAYEDPFEIIEAGDIDALIKVKGIKEKKANKILKKYNRNKDYSGIHIGLHQYGIKITDNLARKLMKRYSNADNAIQKIVENPYTLAYDIDGIGFMRADEIALNMGYPRDSVNRGKAFIEFFMRDRGENGYSWITPDDLYTNMLSFLGEVPESLFGNSLKEMNEEGNITWNEEKTYIALAYYYDLEKKIEKHLRRIMETKSKDYSIENRDEITHNLEERQGWEFTDEQLTAIDVALEENLCVITGPAGTGKTSGVGVVLDVLSDYSFAQTSLSGKAASRLQEVTGQEGYTIHRLLGFNPTKGFEFDEDNPLPYDIIILDECSMIGAEVFYLLIRAIKNGAKLIILGDEGQLESIGAGNVFKDMLDSKTVPVIKLTKIHRQAQKSAIATESIKIRNQEKFHKYGWVGKDVRGELKDLVLDIYDNSLFTGIKIMENYKEAYSIYNNPEDIVAVVPSRYNGDASAYNVNVDIQEYVNPPQMGKKEITFTMAHKNKVYPITYRVGDRVLAKKNNYKVTTPLGNKNPVFNGFLGTIKDITESEMIVDFDLAGETVLPKSYWYNLLLGYAITGHSMQGSECKCIIVGMDYAGYTILSKEWVYTAITRASELCYLVAETKSLTYALSTSKVPDKQTFLRYLLDKEAI